MQNLSKNGGIKYRKSEQENAWRDCYICIFVYIIFNNSETEDLNAFNPGLISWKTLAELSVINFHYPLSNIHYAL